MFMIEDNVRGLQPTGVVVSSASSSLSLSVIQIAPAQQW
jgi:hypothetical protein